VIALLLIEDVQNDDDGADLINTMLFILLEVMQASPFWRILEAAFQSRTAGINAAALVATPAISVPSALRTIGG
jgi:hypothetical protein